MEKKSYEYSYNSPYSFNDFTSISPHLTSSIALRTALATAIVVTYGIPNSIASLLIIYQSSADCFPVGVLITNATSPFNIASLIFGEP